MISDTEPVKISTPAGRTLDDVKKDYAQACGDAGDIQFTLRYLSIKLEEINLKMMDLKKEYQQLDQGNV